MSAFHRTWILSLSMAVVLACSLGCTTRTATRDITDEVSLAAGGAVDVDHVAGTVVVNGAAQETVTMAATATVKTYSLFGTSDPQPYLDEIVVTLTESDGVATVDALQANLTQPTFRFFLTVVPEVDLTLTVPNESDLDVNSSAADITVTDIAGTTAIVLSAGAVSCEDTTGSLDINVSAGSINVTHNDFLAATESIRCEISAGGTTVGIPGNSAFTADFSVSAGSITDGGFTDIDVDNHVAGASATGTVGDVVDPATIRIVASAGGVTLQSLADATAPE
jgi:hypothetical protein